MWGSSLTSSAFRGPGRAAGQLPREWAIRQWVAPRTSRPGPAGPPQHWRTGLELAARWLRAVHGRHPWMARATASFTRPKASPHAMRYTEWVLRALKDTGLSDEEWMARNEPQFAAVSTGGRFPVPHALFEHDDFELDLDVLFDFGLRRTLDGIAVMIGETSG
ncbi:TetR/AcrR family transcriptional regulator C-terminal domain-containing protein [Streptomyces sp. NPDC050423]|uniref:TetR/AcrR family transcriptional regulator C-terminal domain-containing protein n=1 Tax=Streptomyces sp. NPDC050423 TaxID=3155402 RepID=UPI0034309890